LPKIVDDKRHALKAQIDLLYDRIKNSQLHIIPETAHAIHDEKSIELAEILNGYVP